MEFTDLQAFVQAATLGGITRAAERLGVSKSIVSRRLAKLEADLGGKLLTRTTHGISLTEAGEEFLARAKLILAEADEARAAMAGRDGELAGRLRLTIPLSFGIRHLAPALAIFAARHPRLALDISYADHAHDIIAEGFDAAIRIGVLSDSTLLARRIASIKAVVATSPDYLARHGTPRVPQDLTGHDVLIYSSLRDPGLWLFDAKPRPIGVRVHGRIRADSGEGLAAAAIAGLGIGIFPAFMIYRDLEERRLTTILDDYPLPLMGLHLVRPPGSAPHKLTVLTDFLIETFGGEMPWDAACDKALRSV